MFQRRLPPVDPKGISCPDVDEAAECHRQSKRLAELKVKLRQAAENAGAKPGHSVILIGKESKAVVNCHYPTYSLVEGTSEIDARRLGVLVGRDAVEVRQEIHLRSGVTLNEVKRQIGDEMYNALFEDSSNVKLDSHQVGKWLDKERKREATEHTQEVLQFVEERLQQESNTPKVTFPRPR